MSQLKNVKTRKHKPEQPRVPDKQDDVDRKQEQASNALHYNRSSWELAKLINENATRIRKQIQKISAINEKKRKAQTEVVGVSKRRKVTFSKYQMRLGKQEGKPSFLRCYDQKTGMSLRCFDRRGGKDGEA
ncbi:uncharacterized protein VP01_2345g3 [Puccinia sorghi]|uniref:Uncharacterized protein n=1 Tax=Puccinia sorghi TaxID=27349 RepID=A0A0L6V7A2_9BASI|nr:uncharacterized protein VP01_2345g3 [Puccinia sorghi]